VTLLANRPLLQLSAIAQATEFSKIRFRQGEKSLYKALNTSPSIRFPIPVNLDLPAQKVSLIIQSVLGAADISWDGDMSKHRKQYMQEVAMIFKSINSIIRCIIDCQICLGDSVSIHSALMLERSLGSRAWDDSPLQMVQVPNIGAVAVRKLVNAGIRGIEDLEATDARRIETIVGRNPPFGLKVLDVLKSFPKLRVSLHILQSSVKKTPEGVRIQIKADIGFINEKTPDRFGHKLIYVCILAETSDGRKVHFARISGPKLGAEQSLVFSALLISPDQKINCYLMCEGIAGSMRGATVTPKIAPSMFSSRALKVVEPAPTHQPNMSRRRIENVPMQRKESVANDDYGDADIDDDALVKATLVDLDFAHIDNFSDPPDVITRNNTTKNKSIEEKNRAKTQAATAKDRDDAAPDQLPNGRWSCNHKCKDKEACKHYCCKHGLDKPSKKAAPKRVPTDEWQDQPPPKSSMQRDNKIQAKLQLQAPKRKSSAAIEELDLTQQEKKRKIEYAISGLRDYRDLHNLRKNVLKKDPPSSLHSVMNKKPAYCYGGGGEHQLSFLSQPDTTRSKTLSEYGDLQLDEFPTESQNEPIHSSELASLHFSSKASVTSRGSETFGDGDSLFGEAIVDLAGSQDLHGANAIGTSSMQNQDAQAAIDVIKDFADIDFPVDMNFAANNDISSDLPKQTSVKTRAPLFEATSSPVQHKSSKLAKSMLQDREFREQQQGKAALQQSAQVSKDEPEESDVYSDLLDLFDMPAAVDQESFVSKKAPITSETPAQPTKVMEEEFKQVPESFKDLQPWLFQEFGDIVELVNE
jgi:ATP-dependent DNA helicase HFM1/MER3